MKPKMERKRERERERERQTHGWEDKVGQPNSDRRRRKKETLEENVNFSNF